MKPPVNQRLNEVLGLEAEQAPEDIIAPEPTDLIVSSGNPEKDMMDDWEIARSSLRHTMEKANELVDVSLYLAKEKQDAKSVESATMAQREARETALAVIGLHKVKKEIERISSVGQTGGDTNIQNAVFIGTAGEALKLSREMNNDGVRTINIDPIMPALNSGEESKS